jgi:hypothetical protein
MYFYLGNSDYVYIALNKHSGILVYALILKDPKHLNSVKDLHVHNSIIYEIADLVRNF